MTSIALPVLLMLIFVYLFGGAINTGTAYVTYVVPGVLVLCAGFGSAMTAVNVCQDMTTGVIDRFRSMDVSGAAVLGGHVVASVVRNRCRRCWCSEWRCSSGFDRMSTSQHGSLPPASC